MPDSPPTTGLAPPARQSEGGVGGSSLESEPAVGVQCPRCGHADARQWRGRTACEACGLLWAQWDGPPLPPREWLRFRHLLDRHGDGGSLR